MAKIIKKKRKLKLQAAASLLFFVSIFLYLGSVTVLKSYNVILSTQASVAGNEKSKLQEQVATLETTVKQLSDSDYIMKIAEANDLKSIQSNVKVLSGEE